MSVSKLVELRPDQHLLDHEFEGYTLNVRTLPQHVLELTSKVDRLFPDEVQYSFVHAKLFALHNHLVLDYWDYSFNYYYIDKFQQVRNIYFESVSNAFQQNVVYDVPAHEERQSGHFNLSLLFPSSKLAVISDGTGYLHILDTGPRSNKTSEKQNMWSTAHSALVLGTGKYFVVVDTKILKNDTKEILHCLLQSVEQSDSHFNSLLTWVTFENEGLGWKKSGIKQIQGKGIVHYAAIESCSAIYLASDNIFKFTYDSEKDIAKPQKEQLKEIIYTWLQTTDDITITLQLENKFDKNLLNVNVSNVNVRISYAGKDFINGKLKNKINSELTTWHVQENGQVYILITKLESMIWNELIDGGDKNGDQIMDAALVEESHRRLRHLCAETELIPDQTVPGLSTQDLEECDVASEEDSVLVRLDARNHTTTYKIPLSVHQFLFSVNLKTNQVPALCLRHDVDACIWQPYAHLNNNDTWQVKHEGTLNAFGYVVSSKQNRKYVTCAPDFSYSVVCEAKRHLFIYKSNESEGCQLRRRKAGCVQKIKIAPQFVINTEKYGEVLGINATVEYLFVLTETNLIAIEIK